MKTIVDQIVLSAMAKTLNQEISEEDLKVGRVFLARKGEYAYEPIFGFGRIKASEVSFIEWITIKQMAKLMECEVGEWNPLTLENYPFQNLLCGAVVNKHPIDVKQNGNFFAVKNKITGDFFELYLFKTPGENNLRVVFQTNMTGMETQLVPTIDKKEINFSIWKNDEMGTYEVTRAICSLGGCEWDEIEFEDEKSALWYACLQTLMGNKPELRACPTCYAEYMQECI